MAKRDFTVTASKDLANARIRVLRKREEEKNIVRKVVINNALLAISQAIEAVLEINRYDERRAQENTSSLSAAGTLAVNAGPSEADVKKAVKQLEKELRNPALAKEIMKESK